MIDAKVAVITCILPHNYTRLKTPIFINEDKDEVQYLCISDAPQGIYPWWDVIVNRDPELTSRRDLQKYKMQTHRMFPEYDYVIFHDGCVQLKVDPMFLVELMLDSGKKLAFGTHPWRNCSYEEGKVCAPFKSNNEEIIYAQMDWYHEEGFPEHFGLAASTFYVRDNKDEAVNAFFDLWLEETMKGSHRNQISWGYAVWKSGVDVQMWQLLWGKNEFWEM